MKVTNTLISISVLGLVFWPLSSYAKFYKGYEIVFGKEFEGAKKFKEQKLTDLPSFKKGRITNRTVPYDPRAKQYIFVSTHLENTEVKLNQNRVYRYNTITKRLVLIASQTHKEQPMSMGIEGIDGYKLVLRVNSDSSSSSSGPCVNYWKDRDEFKFLDIRYPKAGFKHYVVPLALLDQGEKEATTCRKESGFLE